MADGDGVMLQALFNTAGNRSGREVTVTFDAGRISWEGEKSSGGEAVGLKDSRRKELDTIKGSVFLDDVLLAELDDVQDVTDESDTVSITLHYVSHVCEKTEPRLSTNNVRFFGTKDNSEEWVQSIQTALATKFPYRPKRLLAFINPVSGKRSGVKIFEQKARPLLDKFINKTDAIVTEKAGQIEEILKSKDLTEYDGVLSVGGDGTLAEVVNGLVRRSTRDLEVEESNSETSLSPSPYPIGILPTGSGDIILQNANGSRDVVTATLCIILGETLDKDVASVHSGRRLIRYSNLSACTGFFVEWSRKAETSRWMGMGRLLWGGVYSLAKHSSIEVEIEYLPVESSKSSEEPTKAEASSPTQELSDGWRRVSGQFVQCDGYVLDPCGHRVRSTYGDGQMSLILVRRCSRTAHMKFLAKFFKQNSQGFDFEFVENIKVKAFRLLPVGDWKNNENSYYLNVDGDITHLPEANYSVRIHPGLVRLFARKCLSRKMAVCKTTLIG